MFRTQHSSTPETRRGIILMVVLFMLTLFAIAGISFVLYADAEAAAARHYRDAGTLLDVPDVDPELAFSFFLGQLILDTWDDETGVYSSLRGHSLARTMYGMNTVVNPATDAYTTTDPTLGPLNTVPFIGTGRLHYNVTINGVAEDDYNLVNYMYYPGDGALRDPERYAPTPRAGLRPAAGADNRGVYLGGLNPPYTYPDLNNMCLAHVDPATGAVLLPSFHRNYTGFGDLYVENPAGSGNFVPNPNWFDATTPNLKYKVMRPRPAENPGFPAPEDRFGDVKNLVKAPGGNDSIWIDIGAPVMTLPGGKKYKMLVAPLILDLDGRVNVNVHGNIMGLNQTHGSNQGWGPWEVNLGKVLTGGGGAEWKNLLLGTQTTTPLILGKYGRNQVPTNPGNTSLGDSWPPHFYAQVDFNGARENAASMTPVPLDRMQLPGFNGAPAQSPFPAFPDGRYGNGIDPRGVGVGERRDHALEYNVFRGVNYSRNNDDRVFAASNMAALLRVNDMGSEALTSELLRLCPDSFITNSGGNPNYAPDKIRRLVTTHSFDLHQAGLTPYMHQVADAPDPALPDPNQNRAGLAPLFQWLTFPDLAWRNTPPPAFTLQPPYSEFTLANWPAPNAPETWRGAINDEGRVDLNRIDVSNKPPVSLRNNNATVDGAYPNYTSALPYNGRMDGRDAMVAEPPPQPPSSFLEAQRRRQVFVDELYRKLLQVTGMPPVAAPAAPTDAEVASRRWLAQLAVNMVDYIDEDDISTPFNFYTLADAANDPAFNLGALGQLPPGPGQAPADSPELPRYWVFGTELPRVVVNEVLLENAPQATPAAGDTFSVNVWVELHNTMQTIPAGVPLQRRDGFPVSLFMSGLVPPLASDSPASALPFPVTTPSAGYAPYQVVVANRILPQADNVLGAPEFIRAGTKDQDFDPANVVNRVDGMPQQPVTPPNAPVAVPSPYIDAQGGQSGTTFFLLGPSKTDARSTLTGQTAGGRLPDSTPLLVTPNLTYKVQFDATPAPVPNDVPTGVTVLLRRLANPHIPYNPVPSIQVVDPMTGAMLFVANTWYNPYITVDYIEGIAFNNSTDPATVYASRGKRQPYAAFFKPGAAGATVPDATSPVVDQDLTQPPALPTPLPNTKHNLGQTNNPLPISQRYEWLVHLDRHLISPMELLHVSAYAPHLLTQRFIIGDDSDPTMKFQHYAPWFDQGTPPDATTGAKRYSYRLYRLFEFLQCYDRTSLIRTDGRIPGKININNVWDPLILQAIADAPDPLDLSPANYFNSTHIRDTATNMDIFTQMIQLRSPSGAPAQNDRPFLSLATGLSPQCTQYPLPRGLGGIEETVLRSYDGVGGIRRLFEPPIPVPVPPATDPALHPYLRYQMLTKMFDNLTTRSNVFAVWVTVGFFEVTDDSSHPPKLGAELGKSEGRHIRHRMFAIVDRTNLTFRPQPPAGVPPTQANPGPQPRFNPHNQLTLIPYFAVVK